MELLENVVQPYAWGSRTAIAALQGRPTPSTSPEAELWMGAHPSAPSRVAGSGRRLTERIESDPEATLGAAVASAFGPTLPFLLKVLAADQPLSLQAHPSLAQAREGFDLEEARGVPRSAPHRNYKDRNHKPELLCALTPFDALCGFRAAADLLALLDALAVPALDPLQQIVASAPDAGGIRAAFTWLTTRPAEARAPLVRATVDGCARLRDHGSPWADACAWSARLAALHPDDVGVVSALMLNLVHLAPGEAIYLPAGNLHAYLSGVGIEIMANSDNVLRGGLTPKHVDVDELLRVLVFRSIDVPLVRPERAADGEEWWPTPAREFRLSRIRLDGPAFEARVSGPEIVLCTEGAVTVEDRDGEVELARGASAFVPARAAAWRARGAGTLFRATVGL